MLRTSMRVASTTARKRAMWRWFFFGLAVSACTPQGDPGLEPHGFSDDFERRDLGDDWLGTGGNYVIRNGQLKIEGARNKPLWLRRKLPHDVRIEVEARSDSPDGDIKLEIF